MLYVLGYQSLGEYLILETNTNSLMTADVITIQKLINKLNTQLKNADIVDGNMVITEWAHPMKSIQLGCSKYYDKILLTRIKEDTYKVYDKMCGIIYINEDELKKDISLNKISNCYKEKDEYIAVDTYKTRLASDKFVNDISEKYKTFIAKSKLMGIDNSFNYNIEDNNVIITEYIGEGKRVIIPEFVTIIQARAFSNRGIEQVTLNNGLKYIGANSFISNEIEHIEIPKTVKFIGSNAFHGNRKLMIKDKKRIFGFNRENFKLANRNTVILDKILRGRLK